MHAWISLAVATICYTFRTCRVQFFIFNRSISKMLLQCISYSIYYSGIPAVYNNSFFVPVDIINTQLQSYLYTCISTYGRCVYDNTAIGHYGQEEKLSPYFQRRNKYLARAPIAYDGAKGILPATCDK